MSVYYVDYSAANNGDGSTSAQAGSPGAAGAFNTLTGQLGASGDTFWIRRVVYTSAAYTLTFNVDNVKYIGWPLAGDEYYATRPVGAQAAWDGDAATYMKFSFSSGGAAVFSATGGALQEFHRLWFYNTYNASNSAVAFQNITYNCLFENCYFQCTSAQSGQANQAVIMLFGRFYGCIAQIAAGTSLSSGWYMTSASSTGDVLMSGCSTPSSNAISGLTVYAGGGNPTLNITCLDCTFYASGTGYAILFDSDAAARTMYGKKFFYNCALYGSTTAAYGALAAITGGAIWGMQFDKCSIPAGSLLIDIRASGSNTTATDNEYYFSTVTQTAVSSTYAINNAHSASCLSIENFTAYPGNTTGDVLSCGPCYIRSGTFYHTNEVATTIDGYRDVTIMDYANKVGFFKSYQNAGLVTTDITARTGGASYSIKMLPLFQATYSRSADVYNTGKPITWIGQPSKELIFLSVTAGSHTITVYGAHKIWATAPTANDLWMEGSYYSSATLATIAQFSTRDDAYIPNSPAALTSDTSTWTGDTGMTIFKLAVTITVGQACLVPIRIYLSKFQAGAYVYIDPTPVCV